MIDNVIIEHHIQKHILGVLMHAKYARFRDMRPPKVDTNLYSYHLKLLLKAGFIKKAEQGYTLDKKGIVYVDRVSTSTLNLRSQPKIVTMLVIQNSNGDVLLFKRKRQPYTDLWTLPYGKVHIDDITTAAAAKREALEKLAVSNQKVQHAGDCYIRVVDGEEVVMSTLVHVFRFEYDDIPLNDQLLWARPHKLAQLELAPAVEQIITRTFFKDSFFFEEYVEAFKV